MENDLLLKLAANLLFHFIPAEKKDFGAYFIDKQSLIDSIKFNGEIKDLNKVLRTTGFESGFKKVYDKTVRGYWVKDQTELIDVSKISFEKQKPEKEILLICNSEQEAIVYISKNWDEFKKYISPELRKIHAQDPYFRGVSSYKKTKLLLMAGFELKTVLNTNNRHVYEEDEAECFKLPETSRKGGNSNEILHSWLFPNSLPEEQKIGYIKPAQ